jgi:hypothetical protein
LPSLCYPDYLEAVALGLDGPVFANPALRMELFLNLCWLSLLVPACLLWRQRISSIGLARPLVFACALGCALILLFPVISATDDLHAMRPEMEESERGFRHAGSCAGAACMLAYSSQPVLLSSTFAIVAFEQIDTVLPFPSQTLRTFATPASVGRAPPRDCEHQTSV